MKWKSCNGLGCCGLGLLWSWMEPVMLNEYACAGNLCLGLPHWASALRPCRLRRCSKPSHDAEQRRNERSRVRHETPGPDPFPPADFPAFLPLRSAHGIAAPWGSSRSGHLRSGMAGAGENDSVSWTTSTSCSWTTWAICPRGPKSRGPLHPHRRTLRTEVVGHHVKPGLLRVGTHLRQPHGHRGRHRPGGA